MNSEFGMMNDECKKDYSADDLGKRRIFEKPKWDLRKIQKVFAALHEFSLIFLFAWISIDWRIKNLSCVSPKENVLPKFDGYFLCGTIADNNLIQQGLNIV